VWPAILLSSFIPGYTMAGVEGLCAPPVSRHPGLKSARYLFALALLFRPLGVNSFLVITICIHTRTCILPRGTAARACSIGGC
jgi:hypothetical protein